MKFRIYASFSYGSIYYIHIPCPKNMVERADILARLKMIIWNYEESEVDNGTLYLEVCELFDRIEGGSI